jgi:hypothetical protein
MLPGGAMRPMNCRIFENLDLAMVRGRHLGRGCGSIAQECLDIGDHTVYRQPIVQGHYIWGKPQHIANLEGAST